MGLRNFSYSLCGKFLRMIVLFAIVWGQIFPTPAVLAQSAFTLNLPMPGAMVGVSPHYVPLVIKGIKVFPDNPFRFDFLLDTGHTQFSQDRLNAESKLLIKYFLTALTVPDDDQWVNLSPYEGDRIVPNEFGITEMGRDLLAQDYLLKQLTASLIYPEHDLGKKFWERVYKKAYEKYGDVDIPVSTFNKVWVMPDHATVYEHGTTAVIKESRLKVLLEEDYLGLTQGAPEAQSPRDQEPGTLGHLGTGDQEFGTLGPRGTGQPDAINTLGSQIIREIVLPEIEREVNEGKNFAKLRQIYQSMILAAWFKRKLQDGILAKMYVGANKVAGVDVEDKAIKQKIFDQYLAAYKKGVYNYIREDLNPQTNEVIPRKYFSGGVLAGVEVGKTTTIIPVNQQEIFKVAGNSTGYSLTVAAGLDLTGNKAQDQFLSPEIEESIRNRASRMINKLVGVKATMLSRGSSTYQSILFVDEPERGENNVPQFFRQMLLEVKDPKEIQRLAKELNELWKQIGFDKEIGSLFEYVAHMISDYVGNAPEIKESYGWFYNFLSSADPWERAYALRILVVGFINHMRRNGLHPENDINRKGLSDDAFPLDVELLLGNQRDLRGPQIFQRYFLSLLEVQDTPQWSAVVPAVDGNPNELGLTNEDFLLWSLALMVDPTLYFEGVNDYSDEELRGYLSKYFGQTIDNQNAGIKFLERAFNHESIQGEEKRFEIESLLMKAIMRSTDAWAEKGHRSPFTFAYEFDNLHSIFTGTSIWTNTQYAANPMRTLGLELKYWSEPSLSLLKPSPNSDRHPVLRRQGEKGLFPLYQEAFTSIELRSLFPKLAQSLESNSTGGALKRLGIAGEQADVVVSDATLNRWRDMADQMPFPEGQTPKFKLIQLTGAEDKNAQMPAGVFAYHFRDGAGELVIVLSSQLTDEASRQKAIEHEVFEFEIEKELEAKGETPDSRKVHALASARQIIETWKSGEAIFSYHAQQIEQLTPQQIESLLNENRAWHHEMIKGYFGDEKFGQYVQYEEKISEVLRLRLKDVQELAALSIAQSLPTIGDELTQEGIQALAQQYGLNPVNLSRLLKTGEVVTEAYLKDISLLGELINLNEDLGFGLQKGGEISNGNRAIYNAMVNVLNDYGTEISAEDRDRIAKSLAKMQEGSLEILQIMGVITLKEYGIFKAKDGESLEKLSVNEKELLINRLRVIVQSYQSLNKSFREDMMTRLIDLSMLTPFEKYFNVTKLQVVRFLRGRPNFGLWLRKTEDKVNEIKGQVGGVTNAWIIVEAQKLENVTDWVRKASQKAEEIKDLVGNSALAWDVIIKQGLDKVDLWLADFKQKVDSVQERVGGENNARLIFIRQGLTEGEPWIEAHQSQADQLVLEGKTLTQAWKTLIANYSSVKLKSKGLGNDLGGIDLNAQSLRLKTEGEGISFDMPFDPSQWENIKFDGFTPIILQIQTTNLPVFIGAQDTQENVMLSSV